MTMRPSYHPLVRSTAAACAALALLAAVTQPSRAVDVAVTVQNLGSPGSLFLTPFWIGVHDGTFDLYDNGVAAATFGGLEQLAEDGNTGPLMTRFGGEQAATGGVDGTFTAETVAPPPFNPGESSSFTLSIPDPTVNRYLSYASMLIPSNDAFVANGNPLAHAIFDASGNFAGPLVIDILGSQVLDAGTEVNNETQVAFLSGPNGQTGPNMGTTEGGVVGMHAGFNGSVGNPAGAPMNILGGMTAAGTTVDPTLADFTRNGGADVIARITVVPEPSSVVLVLGAAIGLLVVRTRRRR